MTIRLQVITVSRHKSGVVDTTIIKWDGELCTKERVAGAEWEEVELRVELEEKPTIRVANVDGDAMIANANGTLKLIINNPILFGVLRVNDIIPLISKRDKVITN
jgi:hypothetical protein